MIRQLLPGVMGIVIGMILIWAYYFLPDILRAWYRSSGLYCRFHSHDWQYRYDTTAGIDEWYYCPRCRKERDAV